MKIRQLMATCFFANGKPIYKNYAKYYSIKENPKPSSLFK